MIQSLFILTTMGEVIIEKHWRNQTNRNICDTFCAEANKYDRREDVPPIIATSRHYLINVFRDGLFVLAIVSNEISPLFIIEFLHRIVRVFRDYFGHFEENVIKDNFSTVYQLLDEMIDHGYPFTTELNALKAMIAPPTTAGRIAALVSGKSSVSNVLPDGTSSSMPWRKVGVKYSHNEIYFDICETLNVSLDPKGTVVHFDVSGSIMANSRLSGVPDLTLIFTDPSVIDDCAFHPCVRFSRYERDRVISFIPPDGAFELMQYRVQLQAFNKRSSSSSSGLMEFVPPVFCQPLIHYSVSDVDSKGTLEVQVGTRQMPTLCCNSTVSSNKHSANAQFQAEDVVVEIPFPKSVRTVDVSSDAGTCLFDESTKVRTFVDCTDIFLPHICMYRP